jgi:alkylation response protein AidB-like acyl-CoA dehydrogenase
MLPQVYRHRWMDEEIEAFREQVRRFVSGELSPHLDGWRRQGFIPREVWRPFGQMGFLLPELDEAYGGAGASLAYQLVVQDELAKAECPANTAVHSIAAHYLLDYGTEAQKQRWLPRLGSGEMLAGIALTANRAAVRISRPCARAPGARATSTSSTAARPSSPTASPPTCWWWRCAPAKPAAAASP